MPKIKIKEGIDVKGKKIAMTGDMKHPKTGDVWKYKDEIASFLKKEKEAILGKEYKLYTSNRTKAGPTDILIVGEFNDLPDDQNGKSIQLIKAEKYQLKKPIKIMKVHEIFDIIEEE